MTKIENEFCGYLKVDEDPFAYNVSDNIVTLLPAYSKNCERYEAIDRICSHNIEQPEFLLGNDEERMIAIARSSKFYTGSLNTWARFSTPLIVRASGNADGYFGQLTEDWCKFHAITFWGGNINALYNPKSAIEQPNIDDFVNFGKREIKMRPWKDYSFSKEFEAYDEKVTMIISVRGGGDSTNSKGAYNLGTFNSYIRFTFEKAQSLSGIEKYYILARKLVAILTGQNNVSFETNLSQRNIEGRYFETAVCKIFDSYENYSKRKWHNVIPIQNVLEYIPNLIDKIINDEADALLMLLPEDNRYTNRISITNIQDLCTALEVAYEWEEIEREKDQLVEELKKDIKKTIKGFLENHNNIDVYKETTIKSAFDYLDFTLKNRIFTLYSENRDVVDAVVTKWALPSLDIENIGSFVNLRNNKTHSGKFEWGESAQLYTALFALVYASFFKHVGMPVELAKTLLLQII